MCRGNKSVKAFSIGRSACSQYPVIPILTSFPVTDAWKIWQFHFPLGPNIAEPCWAQIGETSEISRMHLVRESIVYHHPHHPSHSHCFDDVFQNSWSRPNRCAFAPLCSESMHFSNPLIGQVGVIFFRGEGWSHDFVILGRYRNPPFESPFSAQGFKHCGWLHHWCRRWKMMLESAVRFFKTSPLQFQDISNRTHWTDP